ncbi:hypothetical protein SAMN05216601_1066 [Ectopseudomonas composti]|uniref:ParB-like nuclease domain-containing protein n=1 Tax=Ectopseudomonas composti TaxID=658457 RepID=A0A1I5N229_9GAMM|nr:hypothetical protein SAMN05216601_1066 [Pseudomonas composti]
MDGSFVEIKNKSVDELFLDPKNPRLGRNFISTVKGQDEILAQMNDWTLDELAISFIESGFWAQEALIAVEEELYGSKRLIIVEGNRRLAALKKLQDAIAGNAEEKKWRDIARLAEGKIGDDFFEKIPYIKVESREKVSAFLGFRHVTGIKEWEPAEKAQFIAYLIEKEKLTYEQVMRKIGSKTTTVRSHYIAYKLLLQLEDTEDVAVEKIEEKFSLLYLSLRTAGVQKYLGINIKAEPEEAAQPVPSDKEENLVRYSKWMFGDAKTTGILGDSRNIDKFGKILLSEDAVTYLEESLSPNFEMALKKSGGDTEETLSLLIQAGDNLEVAFSTLHIHADKPEIQKIANRLALHLVQITNIIPSLKAVVKEKI